MFGSEDIVNANMYDGRIITVFFQCWCNIMVKLCGFSPRECFDMNSTTLNLSVNFFMFIPLGILSENSAISPFLLMTVFR